jgi:agmatinase
MRTFGDIPAKFASPREAEIVLQSIPYDGTSTWGKGADAGFAAFMDAADNMELYDIETDSEVYRRGIHIPAAWSGFGSPEAMYEGVYAGTKELIEGGKFLTFFGGEHSVSIGILRAFYERYDRLTVLQLDAHADLRPSYGGTPYNHACAVYDASRNTNLIQAGIRSMDVSEKEHMNYDRVFFADDMHRDDSWMDRSIELMTDEVYITLDLDVFDPAIMPATGTPEPGGLDWSQCMTYLKKVFASRKVVGFDIVELAPIEGLHAPQYLAAKLYYKMLSYKFFV